LTPHFKGQIVAAPFKAVTTGIKDQKSGQNSSNTMPPPDGGSTPDTSQPTSLVGTIHDVDFHNFSYPTSCSKQFAIGKTVHVTNGKWSNKDVAQFVVEKVIYGGLKQDGQDQAVVLTACTGQTNFDYTELFVYAKSSHGVDKLASLSPSDWGDGEENNGGFFSVTAFSINNHQLLVRFPAGGSHACAAWTVTKSFQWNGTRFVSTGEPKREANQCQ
jgi:hypothetical protein